MTSDPELDCVGGVYDKLTGEVPHGWKYIRVGPDGKLYVPVGARCNICARDDTHMKIMRVNLDGSGVETVVTGVRNTVGFDFDPKGGDIWYTNNGRDWLSEDLPNDTRPALASTWPAQSRCRVSPVNARSIWRERWPSFVAARASATRRR